MPPSQIVFGLMVFVILILSIAFHEFIHAKVADLAGDPTPGSYGRVTLNPAKHFDPFGFAMICLSIFGLMFIGWGKPVPMRPHLMRNPKWDHFWAVFAAPLSNLAIAVLTTVLIRVLMLGGVLEGASAGGGLLSMFLFLTVAVNVSLFAFNMIPIGPLDGMWIFSTFLPERMAEEYRRFNLSVGMFLFLALALFPVADGRTVLSLIMGVIANPIRDFLLR